MESPAPIPDNLPLVNRMRSPLSSSTNSPLTLPASPSEPPVLQRKLIRRKTSLSYGKKDSSEEIPSTNGSIYNAHSYSKSNSIDSTSKLENLSVPDQAAVDEQPNWESWEPRARVTDNLDETTPFIYGRGTVLDTIIEKNSNSTMQSLAHSKSTGALSSTPSSLAILRHQDSLEISRMRRQRSLSFDDLASIKRSYHEACSSLVDGESKGPHHQIQAIYAQPKKPLLAPPERPPTPPGMPSWTANQMRPIPTRTSSANPRERIMNWWTSHAIVPAGTTSESGRHMSLPLGVTSMPRYHPPRSAYGSIDNHPFNRMRTAKPAHIEPPKPRPWNVTVTKTWEVKSTPAQPLLRRLSKSVSRTVRSTLSPARTSGRSTPSSSQKDGRINDGYSSETNFTTVTAKRRRHSIGNLLTMPSWAGETSTIGRKSKQPDRRHSIGNLITMPSWVGETTTTITSRASEPSRSVRESAHPSRDIIPIPSNDGPSSAIGSPQSLAINNATDSQSSVVGSPRSPAVSQVNLVPVTDLERDKRHKHSKGFCLKCHTRRCLSRMGRWIDMTGERMEDWVDQASMGLCLFCCGFVEGEHDGGSYRGTRGGDGGEMLRPRWVPLQTTSP